MRDNKHDTTEKKIEMKKNRCREKTEREKKTKEKK